MKEQLRQEGRVWVGGSHGKTDANSFLKAKQMKIIFTAPQLFCGFFQTKPEQNAVQITTQSLGRLRLWNQGPSALPGSVLWGR